MFLSFDVGGGFGAILKVCLTYFGGVVSRTVVMLWDCCGDCLGEIAVMAWQWLHFCKNYLGLLWSCCGFVVRWLWDCCVEIAVGMLCDYCEIAAKLL